MKLQNRDLEPQPGRTLMESFEAGVNQARTHGLHRSHKRFGEVSGLLPEHAHEFLRGLHETGVQPCLTVHYHEWKRLLSRHLRFCGRPTAGRGVGAGGAW